MRFRDISAAEWRRVNEVAGLLLDTPPERWADVASKEFDTEEPLRQAAMELARSFDDSTELLGARPLGKIEPPVPETIRNAGERIGAYRIEREIGHGGMGRVYEASRADGAYSRKVAIKLLRMTGSSAHERFRVERRIVAGLEHENIARLHDAGETADGALYFVMEHVEGEPLDVHCRNLEQRPLLELFHTVCVAVAYAHAQGIVHRDLKPGNILVNQAGAPKLLDFGIASSLFADGSTAAYGFTPGYASPEQCRGSGATARSDVYALGLILRYLLGQSVVPKDLDAILEMAGANDPESRYPTAAELVLDLRRYLDGFPVQARPAKWDYRLRLFAQRNRTTVLLAAGVLLASTLGLGAAILQERRVQTQLREAGEFASGILAEESKLRGLAGTTEVRRSLIQKALNHLRSTAPEDARDPALAYVLSDAYLRLGLAMGDPGAPSLGDFPAAEAGIRRARVLSEQIVRRWPQFAPGRQLLAASLAYEEAVVGFRGDNEGCVRLGVRSHAEFQRLPELTPDLARALVANEDMLVRCYTKLGRLDEAIGAARHWIAAEELRPSAPDAVFTAYGRLARTLYEAGDPDEGRAAFRRALDLRRRAWQEAPSVMHRLGLAQEIISAATARSEPCRNPDDRAELVQAAELGAEAHAADTNDATALALYSDTQRCLAMNLAANGLGREALSSLERNRRVLMTADPASSPVRKRLTQVWLETAATDRRLGDWSGAEQALEAARAALQRGRAEAGDAPSLRDYWSWMGDIRERQGRFADALACRRRQVRVMEEYVHATPGRSATLELARTLHEVGLRLAITNRLEGLACLERSVTTFEGVTFPPRAETAQAQRDLARARQSAAGPSAGPS